VQNVDDLYCRGLTRSDRFAIAAAELIGSWTFIIWQTVFLAAWVALNIVGWAKSWDPYPFILMNLVLSLQGAYTAPLIIMAQNREAEKDRLMMQEDFETNRRAAEEIQKIREILEEQRHYLAVLLEQHSRNDRPRAG
jgi:uncharacterized membrane protein